MWTFAAPSQFLNFGRSFSYPFFGLNAGRIVGFKAVFQRSGRPNSIADESRLGAGERVHPDDQVAKRAGNSPPFGA